MMNFVNKKANVVGLVLLIVVGLSASSVYLRHVYSEPPNTNMLLNEVVTEVDLAMARAIELGINDYITNGFSKENAVWYCNYPFPVSINESNVSINFFISERAKAFLDNIRVKGFNITNPIINVAGFEEGFDSLPNESVSVKIDNLVVGIVTDELIQKRDLSSVYKLDWPVFKMYKGMNSWMYDDGGKLLEEIYNQVFYNRPCQIIKSCCTCSETYMIEQGLRDSLKMTLDDVYPALNNSLALLQENFNDTNIVCNYSIEKYHIENIEKFNYSTSQTSYLNCTSDVLSWNESVYDYKFSLWSDDFTLPGSGLDGLTDLGGCPTWDENINATLRDYVEADSVLSETLYESDESAVCTQGSWIRMHTEEFAVDKKLGLLLRFYCEDSTISVEGENDIHSLKSEIVARVAVRLDCPTPTNEDIANTVDENGLAHACPGGSCFPAGTMITMADGGKKAIESVKVGEYVKSFDTSRNLFLNSRVLELEAPVREGIFKLQFEDGSYINVTSEHPFFVKKKDGAQAWASIIPADTYYETGSFPLKIQQGDSIFSEQSNWKTVLSFDYFESEIQTYNLKSVSPTNTFFAEENLVHNKCCFPAGTMISMADGSSKEIETVLPGDEILSYDESSKELVATIVTEIEAPVREGLYDIIFEDGRVLSVTDDHPLYMMSEDGSFIGWGAINSSASYTKGHIETKNLGINDFVFDSKLSFVKIKNIVYKEGDIQTYNLRHVQNQNNFFADGFLAHNKVIGYIGPICVEDIICPSCYGCVVIDGEGTCVPAGPDTECEGTCTVCDGDGNCNKPAPRGIPCSELGDCMMCDGVNTGEEGCVLFDPPEAAGFDCTVECKRCAGDGSGCSMNPDFFGQMDDCPNCQTCDVDGTCAPEVGKKCGNCLQCSINGICEDPRIGKDDCGDKCERCLPDATCGVDLSFPNIDRDCGICQKCGPTGCVPDPAMNGVSCSVCKVCKDGSCSENKPDGTRCGTRGECIKGCQNGQCSIGINPGTECSSNFECASAICDANAKCVVQVDMSGKQCCGDKICNAGDPCCPYDGWTCEACDDITT
jgi:hypothetical protein